MLVSLIFVQPCRLEKVLVVEKRTFKEMRHEKRMTWEKANMMFLLRLYHGEGPERDHILL